MFSAEYRKRMATAMAGGALACALVVSGASAHYGSQGSPNAGDPPEVPPPPSSIAISAAEEYENLRSPERYGATPEPQPVADEPSEPAGFDLVSAAIGAVVAAGLSIVLMATIGMRRPLARRPASG